MTDSTEQELAEYWEERLGGHFIGTGSHRLIPDVRWNEKSCFHDSVSSPIIGHLIQEYMEKEGYIWSLKKGNGYTADYELRDNIKDAWKHHAVVNNENKWFANALGALQAKDGK